MYIIKEFKLEYGLNRLEIIRGTTPLSFGPGLRVNVMMPVMGIQEISTLVVLPSGARINGTYLHLGSSHTEDNMLPIHLFEVPTPQDNHDPEFTTTLDDDFPPAS